jgi:hypothetical protein
MNLQQLNDARARGEISCSLENWDPYRSGTIVFVFRDKQEARHYAQACSGTVVVTLRVDSDNLEPDRSAESDADVALQRIAPDLDERLARTVSGSPWASSEAHRGPIPISAILSEETLR